MLVWLHMGLHLLTCMKAMQHACCELAQKDAENPVLALPRTDPARKAFLRQLFIKTAHKYIGALIDLPGTSTCNGQVAVG